MKPFIFSRWSVLILAALMPLSCGEEVQDGDEETPPPFGGSCSPGERRCEAYGQQVIYRCEEETWTSVTCREVCEESGLAPGSGGCILIRDMGVAGCDCRDPEGECEEGETRCDRLELQICQEGGWLAVPCQDVCSLAGTPEVLSCAHSPSKNRSQCYCRLEEGEEVPPEEEEGSLCTPEDPLQNPCGVESICCRWSVHSGRCQCDYCSADGVSGC